MTSILQPQVDPSHLGLSQANAMDNETGSEQNLSQQDFFLSLFDKVHDDDKDKSFAGRPVYIPRSDGVCNKVYMFEEQAQEVLIKIAKQSGRQNQAR